MVEKMLSLDQAKEIAKKYVQQTEQMGDVEVNGLLSFEGGLLLYVMEGKVKRHVITEGSIDARIAERSFKLQLLAKGRNKGGIVGYLRSDWVSIAPQPPSNPHVQVVWSEPSFSPPSFMEQIADIALKNAKAEEKRASAHLKEERAKTIKNKRNKPLWML